MTSVTAGNTVTPSGDPLIDGLLQGYSWTGGSPVAFTYAFYSATTTTAEWTTAQMDDVDAIFAAWSAVANVTFTLYSGGRSDLTPSNDFKTSGADITLTLDGPPDFPGALAFSTFPDPTLATQGLSDFGDTRTTYPYPEGDVFIFNTNAEFSETNMAAGGYGFTAIMHEIGHSLGLKHPFDDGGNSQPLEDTRYWDEYYTIMGYETPQDVDYGSVRDPSKGFPSTPMPLDLLAIQYLYGANTSTNTGSNDYDLSTAQFTNKVQTIWDAGGTDTLDAANLTHGITMSLLEGSYTHIDGFSTVALAYNPDPINIADTYIENAIGSAFDDNITGNQLANTIDAGAGNDTLDGYVGGPDTLIGGLGNDTYIIENSTDVAIEVLGQGVDAVRVNASTYDMSTNAVNVKNAFSNVAGVPCFITGNDLNNVITGNTGADTLDGGNGNDTLDAGGGGGGPDTLIGGMGDDVFIVYNAVTVVTESAGQGIDLVKSTSPTFTLGANVDNLTLLGSALAGFGNGDANVITGNALANTLDGGAGNDTLIGGAGNDTYYIDSASDVLTDTSGIDTVYDATVDNYHMATGIETLILTGVANLSAFGNATGNLMLGNDGNNTLDGGMGADTLQGGLGDDTYILTDPGDTVFEDSGALTGTDTIITSLNFTLPDNVENLTMTGTISRGTGNDLGNIIIGNNAANLIDGGIGADTMQGGLGADVYIVDNTGDVVIENSGVGTGIDIIQSSVDYTLSANVEILILTAPGHTATGTAGIDTLIGTGGSDTLDGAGGADVMTGNGGNDTYIVDNPFDKLNDSGGTDTVIASINYTLATGFENLTLAVGVANLNGTGNSFNNVLTGNAGNNTLDGGTGVDTLAGGLGDDTYIVRSAADIVTDTGGTDTVIATVNFNMELSAVDADNLVLSGATAVTGIGNALANTIIGGSGTNILDGGSGGNDVLIGGLGSDTYIVNHAGVSVTEASGGGTDTVKTSLDGYVLDSNVENIVLTGFGMTATGNNLANSMTGTSGNDTLDGSTGADKMAGGFGDDSYFVDMTTDAILENSGAGTDYVTSSATSYTLGLNVENLTLTGAALKGTGNNIANMITGDDLANTLLGMGGNDTLEGGKGADTLTGGLNADTFVFKTASMDGTLDAITDFSAAAGGDKIDISDLLSGSGYIAGTSVITNFVQIQTVGNHSVLSYDFSGSGAAWTQIATINGTNLQDEVALVQAGHLFLG